MKPERIIFFDGVCGLCNGFVDFVLAEDKKAVFQFSPVQGATARAKLPERLRGTPDPSTIVYLEGKHLYEKSEAVFRIAAELGGRAGLLAYGKILPRWLADQAYDWTAQHRYKWFGKRDACRVPTPEQRSRFLD